MKKKSLIKNDALKIGMTISKEEQKKIQGGAFAPATMKVRIVATEERKYKK